MKKVEFRFVVTFQGKHFYSRWFNYFKVPRFLTRRGKKLLGFIGGQVRVTFPTALKTHNVTYIHQKK